MDQTEINTAALKVSGLGHRYGDRPALADVTFCVAPGQFKVLLGPNGAGKTTLFSLITRLFDSTAGSVRICGADLKENTTRSLAQMGVVFQAPTLDLDLSVNQNLIYHAALHGMAKAEAHERIETELARLDMAARRGEKVRQLNGGHRRRIEIARALLHRPRLLLLDEPTVGLDVPTRRDIVQHIHDLSRDDGIAVLWATHLIDEIFSEDSVIILHQGRVRADGGTAEVADSVGAADIADAFERLTGATDR